MKILIDMNLSPEWVPILQEQGWEAIHWSSIGDPRDPDRVIFDYAADHGYVVFTHDLDFGAILAASGAKTPSVVQLRVQDVSTEALRATAVTLFRSLIEAIDVGALVIVDQNRTRVRILPLSR